MTGRLDAGPGTGGEPHPAAARLRDDLRGRLIAAAATPLAAAGVTPLAATGSDLDAAPAAVPDPGSATRSGAEPAIRSGAVDPDVFRGYLDGLVKDGAGGLAVLAHTGRGPFLSTAVRAEVIRVAVGTGVPVVVGVGGRPGESLDDLATQAVQAAELGADGLLVFPEPGTALARHDAVWRAAGLPMLAFDLYARPYSVDELTGLLRHPGVAGVKVARLHDAIACQAALAAAIQADRLPVTGEDRMFGPSLLWGARAALVGIAAAAVPVTAAVLRAFADADHAGFVAASGRLDRLAAATFTEPMEGYVQRMLWIAAAEGRIPEETVVDRFGPALPAGERDRVLRVVGAL